MSDQPMTHADWLRAIAAWAPEHADRLQDAATRIDRLQEALEELGESSDTCVGYDLGRRCSYCQCEGKNMD